ncbi:hypothetical protein [Cupriavidus necator]
MTQLKSRLACKLPSATLLAIGLSLAGSASAQAAKELDGFKAVKFGAPVAELKALGLVCEASPAFAGLDPIICKGQDTLFGMRATVVVTFRNDKAISIGVWARHSEPFDVATAYTKVYGKPKTFIGTSIGGTPLRTRYWLSKSGTSISIDTPMGKPASQQHAEYGTVTYEQLVVYGDQGRTAEMLARERVARNPERDY